MVDAVTSGGLVPGLKSLFASKPGTPAADTAASTQIHGDGDKVKTGTNAGQSSGLMPRDASQMAAAGQSAASQAAQIEMRANNQNLINNARLAAYRIVQMMRIQMLKTELSVSKAFSQAISSAS